MNTTTPTITLNLNPTQFEWLQTFLERSRMEGSEVPHFLQVVNAIRVASQPQESAELPVVQFPNDAELKSGENS